MPYGFSERMMEAADEYFSQDGRFCKKCGEELLIDHEILAGVCLTCMMIEFQESQREEEGEGER